MPDSKLLKDYADRCVKCGMCLPQCPTYQVTRDEGESPRGRISLIQGLLNEQLPHSDKLVGHLENCLKCRACERICPSQVPYGELIDGALTHIEHTQRESHPHRNRLLARVVHHTSLRRMTHLLRVYQRSGLRTLARMSGLLKLTGLQRVEAQLPELTAPQTWEEYYPPRNAPRGDVALFLGCIADAFDAQTTRASITVLTALGYGVHIPRAQTCCGALHLHNGAPEHAAQLARKNLAAFDLNKVSAVISTASGCGATLSEYAHLDPQATAFARRVMDISAFLTTIAWPENVQLTALNQRVAIQDPCSLTNVLRQADKPYALLRKIPGIELVSLPEKSRCCGAAGSYMLTHPKMADRLRDAKIEGIETLNVRTLVSSNIGCALHLAAGLRAHNQAIEVIHPITLLARQLEP